MFVRAGVQALRNGRLGAVRGMSEQIWLYPTKQKAPVLNARGGYDPEWFHSDAAKKAALNRWINLTYVGVAAVTATTVYVLLHPHEHEHDPEVLYDHMRVTHKVPRYPWGDREMIGTPDQRHKWHEEDAE